MTQTAQARSAVFRAASELSRPNMGATLLAVAPESNRQKLAETFADQAFHHGWAQMELGWLRSLCGVVLACVADGATPLHLEPATRGAVAELLPAVDVALAEQQRCHIDEIDEHGERHLLVVNFRRQPGGAPRKMLL